MTEPGDEGYVPPPAEPYHVDQVYMVGYLSKSEAGEDYPVFPTMGNTPMSLEVATDTRNVLNFSDAVTAYGPGTDKTSDYYKIFEIGSITEYREIDD